MNFFYRQLLPCICCFLCLRASSQIDTTLSALRHRNMFDTSVKTPLLLIADIIVTGNKKTKPYIIEREIPFKQGDYLTKKDLEQKLILAREQVVNTSLFVDVSVYVSSQAGELVFINVDVKERWYLFPLPFFKLIDRNFNEWWVEDKRSLDHIDYGLKLIQGNVSGRNDKLNLFLVTGYDHQIDFEYQQPFADRALKSGFDARFLLSQQHEVNYGTALSKQLFYKQEDTYLLKEIRAELSYLYRPAIKTHHTFKLSYVHEQIADTILKLNPNYFFYNKTQLAFPEISYSVAYFDEDYIAYPLHGVRADFSVLQRGLSKYMDMTQFGYHVTYSHPFFLKTNIQLQSAAIIKAPFDQPFYNLPLFNYGDVFFRGLEYYVIDGVAGGIARATERKKLCSFAITPTYKNKTRATIPFTIYATLYGDAGYAYDPMPGNSLLNNKFIRTWGAGVDVISIYDAVFKFEYSFNQLGGQALFVHVEADF